jgi:uncharacterized protein (DUF849 family)
LTGAVPSKNKYPTLPTAPAEIADEALACAEAGASVVHLHMRNLDGNPTQNSDYFRDTISQIRRHNSNLVICVTTTSRGSSNRIDRGAPLLLDGEYKPDFASLTLGSYNTPTGINLNPAADIEWLLIQMKSAGIRPEFEIFEPGMIQTFDRLRTGGLVDGKPVFNILLGVEGASGTGILDIANMLVRLPPDAEVAVAGIGMYQRPLTALAVAIGANVRVGMEDDPRGEFPGWRNVDSVKRATRAAELVGRAIETPENARQRFGLA